MRKLFETLVAFLLASSLGACALPVHDQRYAWTDGWREGVVQRREAMRAGDGGILGPHCSAWFSEQGASNDWIVFQYARMGQKRWWSLAVSSASAWRVGDRALFNVMDCAKAPVRLAG